MVVNGKRRLDDDLIIFEGKINTCGSFPLSKSPFGDHIQKHNLMGNICFLS